MDTPGLKGELQPEYLEAEVYSMNTVHPPPPRECGARNTVSLPCVKHSHWRGTHTASGAHVPWRGAESRIPVPSPAQKEPPKHLLDA